MDKFFKIVTLFCLASVFLQVFLKIKILKTTNIRLLLNLI